MRLQKRSTFQLISVLVLAIAVNITGASAINSGFQTNDLPSEEKDAFINNIDLQRIDEEPDKAAIACFDVNEDRMIAIGQDASERKTVCIYSDTGVFQYGYMFDCRGDFGLEWDEDTLHIYFVRSNVLVAVSPSGEISDVLEVPHTIENNSYINGYMHTTEKRVKGTEYSAENDGIFNWLASSYSRITATDSTGAERIVYDASAAHTGKIIMVLGFFCILIAAVSIGITKQLKNSK